MDENNVVKKVTVKEKEIDDTIIELDCELPTEIKITSLPEINS